MAKECEIKQGFGQGSFIFPAMDEKRTKEDEDEDV